jgi:Fe2+ or Zn2+ uptake regulation protein
MDPNALIRAAGLRVTRQRVAVLTAVHAAPHASAATVLQAVTATLPDVSHQAVYDCLAHLTAAGQLRRFVIDGGPARYETRTRDNHHHTVCRICGELSDVDCATGEAPCVVVADPGGFVVDEAEIIYRGRCARCAASGASFIPLTKLETPNG